MKHIKTNVLGLFFLIALGAFTACENETFEPRTENEQALIQASFDSDLFSKSIPFDFDVHWDQGMQGDRPALGNFIEFPIAPKTSRELQESGITIKFSLLARNNNDGTYSYYLGQLSQMGEIEKSITIADLNYFTGNITIKDFDQKTVFSAWCANGEQQRLARKAPKDCGFDNPGCEGGEDSYIDIVTHHYKDWYKVYPDGSMEYTHTQNLGSTRERVYLGENLFNYAYTHPDYSPGGNTSSGGTTGGLSTHDRKEEYLKQLNLTVEEEEQISRNSICAPISFNEIGSARVATMTNLGFFARSTAGSVMNAQFSTGICLTVPDDIPSHVASSEFVAAWTLTMRDVASYLTNLSPYVTVTENSIKDFMYEFLLSYLKNFDIRINISRTYCAGSKIQEVEYCL